MYLDIDKGQESYTSFKNLDRIGILTREGISGEVAKVAQFCSVQPTAPKATRQRNI